MSCGHLGAPKEVSMFVNDTCRVKRVVSQTKTQSKKKRKFSLIFNRMPAWRVTHTTNNSSPFAANFSIFGDFSRNIDLRACIDRCLSVWASRLLTEPDPMAETQIYDARSISKISKTISTISTIASLLGTIPGWIPLVMWWNCWNCVALNDFNDFNNFNTAPSQGPARPGPALPSPSPAQPKEAQARP